MSLTKFFLLLARHTGKITFVGYIVLQQLPSAQRSGVTVAHQTLVTTIQQLFFIQHIQFSKVG